MRIGVIGATGLLGHHTAQAICDAGHALVVLHRPGSKVDRLAPLSFESRVADLDSAAQLVPALRGLDGVVNAAAYYPTIPRPWRVEVERALKQMHGFYDACVDARVPRVLYVGGSIALRKREDGAAADETSEQAREPEDKSPYVQVKWVLDRLAMERAGAGLPLVTGIPTMTFGEHDHGPTTGRFIVEIANRTMAGYVAGKRNTVYAGDAGRGLLQALLKGRPGERYIIGGENVTMEDLVQRIARIAAVPPPKAVPLAVARAASYLQEMRYLMLGGHAPKLTSTAIAVMAAGQYLSIAKAQRELDYQPQVSLDDAIARALAWFRANGYVTA